MRKILNRIFTRKLFEIYTYIAFAILFFLVLHDRQLAVTYTSLLFLAGLKFIIILVTLSYGALALSLVALVLPFIVDHSWGPYTLCLLFLCSIKASYSTITISLERIGANKALSNLNLRSMLQMSVFNALVVAFIVCTGLFLLESPQNDAIWVYWGKIFVIELLGAILAIRTLSLYR